MGKEAAKGRGGQKGRKESDKEGGAEGQSPVIPFFEL